MPRKYVPKNTWRRGKLPNDAEVRAAVEAACNETGASAEDVIGGVTGRDNGISNASRQYTAISRARAYAALALRAIFEEGQTRFIAAMCGARHPITYLGNLDCAIRDTRVEWWNDDAFMRVIEAVEAFQREQGKMEAAE